MDDWTCDVCGRPESDEDARWHEATDEDGNEYCSECWNP